MGYHFFDELCAHVAYTIQIVFSIFRLIWNSKRTSVCQTKLPDLLLFVTFVNEYNYACLMEMLFILSNINRHRYRRRPPREGNVPTNYANTKKGRQRLSKGIGFFLFYLRPAVNICMEILHCAQNIDSDVFFLFHCKWFVRFFIRQDFLFQWKLFIKFYFQLVWTIIHNYMDNYQS